MLYKKILKDLHDESSRLYVTGPASASARVVLQSSLKQALQAYDEYRTLTAREERIGG